MECGRLTVNQLSMLKGQSGVSHQESHQAAVSTVTDNFQGAAITHTCPHSNTPMQTDTHTRLVHTGTRFETESVTSPHWLQISRYLSPIFGKRLDFLPRQLFKVQVWSACLFFFFFCIFHSIPLSPFVFCFFVQTHFSLSCRSSFLFYLPLKPSSLFYLVLSGS